MTTPENHDAQSSGLEFTGAQDYADLAAALGRSTETYESYVGICDVLSPDEARAMAQALRDTVPIQIEKL
ncbi:hypothetical protein HJC99_03915 [Candidatus Saccharibacteria bacterium]|nr:hypothetical protein [Candidatus Saccharibacteria bacterium]